MRLALITAWIAFRIEAANVSVTLIDAAGVLSFEVNDDGRGFDSATMTRGAGLNGMSDRLDTVGGQVTIDSVPGRGTVVRGTVAVKSTAEVEGAAT